MIGQCVVATCAKQVCGPPPHRTDGKVHGEHCSCLNGCGKLFCKTHAKLHAKTHAGPGAGMGCFPNLALTTSAPVIVGSLAALARTPSSPGRDEEPDGPFRMLAADQQLGQEVGDFLTDITPGADALVTASLTEKRAEPLWLIQPGIMRGPLLVDGPRLAPGVGFYTRARLDRLACLALTEFGDAWRVVRSRNQGAGYTTDANVTGAWDHCARWAEGRARAPTAIDIAAWVAPIARRWNPLEVKTFTSTTVSPEFAAAPAPSGELERARWLVGSTLDEGQPAGRREAMA
jgi:hypothetical protein